MELSDSLKGEVMTHIELATVEEAKKILGRNFHGPEEVNDLFNCDLNKRSGWIIPYDKRTLEKYADQCILFPGCAKDSSDQLITLSWFTEKFPKYKKPTFIGDLGHGYGLDDFHAKTTCQHGQWYLIHKQFPDTRSADSRIIVEHDCRKVVKTEDKIKTLQPHERLEKAIVYVFGMLLHHFYTKEKMYHYDYVLCDDLASDGRRIRIGYFEYLQIYIGTFQPGIYWNILGIAPGVKPLI